MRQGTFHLAITGTHHRYLACYFARTGARLPNLIGSHCFREGFFPGRLAGKSSSPHSWAVLSVDEKWVQLAAFKQWASIFMFQKWPSKAEPYNRLTRHYPTLLMRYSAAEKKSDDFCSRMISSVMPKCLYNILHQLIKNEVFISNSPSLTAFIASLHAPNQIVTSSTCEVWPMASICFVLRRQSLRALSEERGSIWKAKYADVYRRGSLSDCSVC